MKISKFELGGASQVYRVVLCYNHYLPLFLLKQKVVGDFCQCFSIMDIFEDLFNVSLHKTILVFL